MKCPLAILWTPCLLSHNKLHRITASAKYLKFKFLEWVCLGTSAGNSPHRHRLYLKREHYLEGQFTIKIQYAYTLPGETQSCLSVHLGLNNAYHKLCRLIILTVKYDKYIKGGNERLAKIQNTVAYNTLPDLSHWFRRKILVNLSVEYEGWPGLHVFP